MYGCNGDTDLAKLNFVHGQDNRILEDPGHKTCISNDDKPALLHLPGKSAFNS